MNDVASTEEDPLLGEVVDERFRLDQKLGEGAVGRVYEATQLSIDRSVAIKVLHGEFRRDDEYQKRFRREARAISSFNHPNIVRLVDYGEDEDKGLTYLAMEFVKGLELYDINEKGRLDPRCALEITSQVAAGLSAAHEQDIVHRDLKASNIILVSVPGGIFQAKVLDFGVAFPKNQSKRMTTDGEVFGTPAYMSPEQARGKAVDAASDIYSLGIVLWEMLTGELPFEGENTVELMVKHLQNDPPPLAQGLPGGQVPAGLQELLDALLAKNPNDRPSSGDAVRDRIEEIRSQNQWGALHVDSNLGLEEALDNWVLPEGDDRLTTEEETGRPGSDRQRSLGASDEQAAVPEAQRETSNEQGVDPEGNVPANDSAARGSPAPGQPAQGSPGPPDSQQARAAAPDQSQTTHTAMSVDRLKVAVLVLCVLCVLVAGGIAGYLVFGTDDGSSAGDDSSTVAAGASDDASADRAGAPDTGTDTGGPEPGAGDVGGDTSGETDTSEKPRHAGSDDPGESSDESTGSDEGGREADDETTSTGTPTSTGDDSPTPGSRPPPDPEPEPKPDPQPTTSSGSTGSSGGSGGDSGGSKDESGGGDDKSGEDDDIDNKLKNQLEQLDRSEF